MADKSRFGPILTETDKSNQHGRVVDPGVFNKNGFAGYKMIITSSALRAPLVIYHFISSAPS